VTSLDRADALPRIVVISNACFSGTWRRPGWQLLAAASSDEPSHSHLVSESGRYRGGQFVAGLAQTQASEHGYLLAPLSPSASRSVSSEVADCGTSSAPVASRSLFRHLRARVPYSLAAFRAALYTLTHREHAHRDRPEEYLKAVVDLPACAQPTDLLCPLDDNQPLSLHRLPSSPSSIGSSSATTPITASFSSLDLAAPPSRTGSRSSASSDTNDLSAAEARSLAGYLALPLVNDDRCDSEPSSRTMRFLAHRCRAGEATAEERREAHDGLRARVRAQARALAIAQTIFGADTVLDRDLEDLALAGKRDREARGALRVALGVPIVRGQLLALYVVDDPPSIRPWSGAAEWLALRWLRAGSPTFLFAFADDV
jgi:hypothetical protein